MTVLGDLSLVIDIPVRGNMDAFQHDTDLTYFRCFESTRIDCADRIGLYQYQQNIGIGPVLPTVVRNFIKPLSYPGTICVGYRTVHPAHSEIHQEHAIYSRRLKR